MKTINLFILFLAVVSATLNASARTVQVYGVREQAAGNCAIMGGYLGSCTVANWKTNYQVCDCNIPDYNGYNSSGDSGYTNAQYNSCRTTQTYGIREQAPGNCAVIGGQALSCTVTNWSTGYQVCQCQICN